MARKKKIQLPIAFCGSYFPKDYVNELKKEVLEEIDDEIEPLEFLKDFIGSFDFSDFQHLKQFLVIDSSMVEQNGEDLPEGYYIGVDFLSLPEHFSQKRAKIDVRKVFEDVGMIGNDEDPDTVQIFNRILNV